MAARDPSRRVYQANHRQSMNVRGGGVRSRARELDRDSRGCIGSRGRLGAHAKQKVEKHAYQPGGERGRQQ